MTEQRPSPGSSPSVCPFVALAEDRDRRADAPDERNRCYAERAPRRRDLVYQSDYCYSPEFASCTVFLAWAARNAAEPSSVTEAASQAWASGVAAPVGAEGAATGDAPAVGASGEAPDELGGPTPERGLFGLSEPAEAGEARGVEQLEWVSVSAWAEAPWDEEAEHDAELEEEGLEDDDWEDEGEEELADAPPVEEATTAPKVPAAVPLRRRKPPQEPIRSPGSGEWYYADPPGREPLVSRRHGVTPAVLLAVLAVLVVSVVAFLVAAQLGHDPSRAAATSPAPASPMRPPASRAPSATLQPTLEPEPSHTPRPEFYRVRAGDSLTAIAQRFDVRPQHLQCLNGILDRDVIQLGARLQIPPEGFSCTPGWRNATPEP